MVYVAAEVAVVAVAANPCRLKTKKTGRDRPAFFVGNKHVDLAQSVVEAYHGAKFSANTAQDKIMTEQTSLSIMADIGGTNTRVALAHGAVVRPDSIQRFKNADYTGLEAVLAAYLENHPDIVPDAACAAIAGPVRDGKGTLTNLDWTVDRELLTRATGARIATVINDLQAQGHAVGHLNESQCVLVKDGHDAGPQAARLVVGVGTGFNAAPVYRASAVTLVPPGEAGHTNLPASDALTNEFSTSFASEHGFCSVEDALSGRGLGHIYSWLAKRAGSSELKDPPEIMETCANGQDPLATETVAFFAKTLGNVCGNLALTTLPFGGIYLVGGVARAVTPYLAEHGFSEAFSTKGRFSDFMRQFNIWSVDDDYAALSGMAALLQELRTGTPDRH